MLSDSRLGRPLVTLAVFAFNQVHFIEDAMRAAVAQSYHPLEIIISDDQSTDDTFEKVRQFASNYGGPHSLVVRRSVQNRGTLQHFFDVADIASGELLIASAADDLSLPHRVETMVASWQESRYAAAFADYAVIDESGCVIHDYYSYDGAKSAPSIYLPDSANPGIHGASSSYDLAVIRKLERPSLSTPIRYEDTWLSFMLSALNLRIVHIPSVLVQYRQHAASISNFSQETLRSVAGIMSADHTWQQRGAAYSDTLNNVFNWYIRGDRPLSANLPKLENDKSYFKRVAEWNNLSYYQRALSIRYARQPWMRNSLIFHMLPIVLRRLILWFR